MIQFRVNAYKINILKEPLHYLVHRPVIVRPLSRCRYSRNKGWPIKKKASMHLSEGVQKLVFLFIWQPYLGRYVWHRFKKSPDRFSFLRPRAHDVVGSNGSMVTYVRHSPRLRTVLWTVPIKDQILSRTFWHLLKYV